MQLERWAHIQVRLEHGGFASVGSGATYRNSRSSPFLASFQVPDDAPLTLKQELDQELQDSDSLGAVSFAGCQGNEKKLFQVSTVQRQSRLSSTHSA